MLSRSSAGARRILLVEDHPDTLEMTSYLLRGLSYTVETADDIRSALAAAESGPFDLVISDLGLPDGSGLDLMRQLRQRHGEVTGIALSGYGMEEDLRLSREAGFREHLTKPVTFQTLQAAIERALG